MFHNSSNKSAWQGLNIWIYIICARVISGRLSMPPTVTILNEAAAATRCTHNNKSSDTSNTVPVTRRLINLNHWVPINQSRHKQTCDWSAGLKRLSCLYNGSRRDDLARACQILPAISAVCQKMCHMYYTCLKKRIPRGESATIQAEAWWRASIWRSHRKVVIKQCSYHNNIIDIQNRLPYSKVVYPAIIVLFSCLMEVNHGVRTGPDYPFR